MDRPIAGALYRALLRLEADLPPPLELMMDPRDDQRAPWEAVTGWIDRHHLRRPVAASALVSPVEALLGRAIVLIWARDHARVPTEKLLGTRWKAEHEIVPERADVVDLLLEE